MKNINIIQVRQKMEAIHADQEKLLEMLRYCEKQERLRGQTTLTTHTQHTHNTTQHNTTQHKRWSDYALKRWPTPEEFTLWAKKTNPADRLELYEHVTGQRIRSALELERLTLELYPKFEVVQ